MRHPQRRRSQAAQGDLRAVVAALGRGPRQRHPHRKGQTHRPLGGRAGDVQCAVGPRQHHAVDPGDLLGLGDALADHVPAFTAQPAVGLALGGAAQVGQQVGAAHLDRVGDGLDAMLRRGVADRIDIGHRDGPAGCGLADPGAQAQAPPDHPAGAQHLAHHPGHQVFMVVAGGAVFLQGLGQLVDAGIADAHRFAAGGVTLAGQQASGQQVDLDQVVVGPAGRAPHLAQAALVGKAQAGRAGRHPASVARPAAEAERT